MMPFLLNTSSPPDIPVTERDPRPDPERHPGSEPDVVLPDGPEPEETPDLVPLLPEEEPDLVPV